jgi:hypothetical protein
LIRRVIMNRKKYTVKCDKHGRSAGCVVCQHLFRESGLRYHATRPFRAQAPKVWQAWCERCHPVVQQEGGWTARALAFAGMGIICTPCYREVLSRHQRVPLVA